MRRNICSLFFVLCLLLLPSQNRAEATQRTFSLHVPFAGIVLGQDQNANLDIKVLNRSDEGVQVNLDLVKDPRASEWKTLFTTEKWGGFGVSGVRVGHEKPYNEVPISLSISPAKGTPKGLYSFSIEARDPVSGFHETIPIKIKVEGEKLNPVNPQKNLTLETKYPSLQGAAGQDFSFEVKVKNGSAKDSDVSFLLEAPDGWTGKLSPHWDGGKDISAIKLDKGTTETLKVDVKTPEDAKKGDYPLKLTAKMGEVEKAFTFHVNIEGSYNLKMLPEGQRLNLDLVAGKERAFTFLVWNEGSTPVDQVQLFPSAPSGWEVKTDPKTLDSVSPLAGSPNPMKVTVRVKCPEGTLPGDYQLKLTASGKQSKDSNVLRATVSVSTKWGWVGFGIIALVLLLLAGIFLKLGRR